jgi:hypothetical protein
MLATKTIYNEALIMQPLEKVKLIDKLILSLDIPNQFIEKQWNDEVEDRINAFENGKIKTIMAKEVFDKYEN